VLLFCSPPEFIETLKAIGVDLVELTGNHNNDFGSEYNTETIQLYESLGWGTVGGGLDDEDAAKAFLTDEKGTRLAFLAYNFPDSPNGIAISGVDSAGANSFDFSRIESDILEAKQQADFVTVNVQYWECYAYPDGYVEFPECDVPIGEQEENFKRIVDLGADMVVGSSAHQPQTWEIYNGKPIYYGLGNLFFDQTRWPGTERGLVLSNYFIEGALIQTRITPTVYGEELQPRVMTAKESEYLLTRLKEAR
jgi:poly-gamma-glutamate synthesis protein (capsule biosynthesis protein)